ncbi:MAG: hypothetical protein M1318_00865 [Firmicutes bacterium]|nr:hypothetical protein [Bacillota bacterium]
MTGRSGFRFPQALRLFVVVPDGIELPIGRRRNAVIIFATRRIRQLSGALQQRVAIARGISSIRVNQ